MHLVSLFDGIGGAMDSCLLAGIYPASHIAVEIDPVARGIADWRAQKNGWISAMRPCDDVRELRGKAVVAALPPGDILLVGGVPCITRSLANKLHCGRGRSAVGTESGLITEFVRVRDELEKAGRTVHFVVENVPSHADSDRHYSELLGVSPVEINAAMFGAQHRRRLFWCSWAVSPPRVWSEEVFADIAEDNPPGKRYDFIFYPARNPKPNMPRRVGVLPAPSVLMDIAKGQADNGIRQGYRVLESGKCFPIRAGGTPEKVSRGASESDRVFDLGGKARSVKSHGRGVQDGAYSFMPSLQDRVYAGKMKAVPATSGGRTERLAAIRGDVEMRDFPVGDIVLRLPVVLGGARAITITECERLFGLPDGETAMPGVSKTARRRCLGGGWTRGQMAWVLGQVGNRGLV